MIKSCAFLLTIAFYEHFIINSLLECYFKEVIMKLRIVSLFILLSLNTIQTNEQMILQLRQDPVVYENPEKKVITQIFSRHGLNPEENTRIIEAITDYIDDNEQKHRHDTAALLKEISNTKKLLKDIVRANRAKAIELEQLGEQLLLERQIQKLLLKGEKGLSDHYEAELSKFNVSRLEEHMKQLLELNKNLEQRNKELENEIEEITQACRNECSMLENQIKELEKNGKQDSEEELRNIIKNAQSGDVIETALKAITEKEIEKINNSLNLLKEFTPQKIAIAPDGFTQKRINLFRIMNQYFTELGKL